MNRAIWKAVMVTYDNRRLISYIVTEKDKTGADLIIEIDRADRAFLGREITEFSDYMRKLLRSITINVIDEWQHDKEPEKKTKRPPTTNKRQRPKPKPKSGQGGFGFG